MTLRHRVYVQLDLDTPEGPVISPLNIALLFAVLGSATVAALLTEPEVTEWRPLLRAALGVFALLFTIEYAARVWVKAEDPAYRGGPGPFSYLTRWFAIIDLLALIGVWLEAAVGFGLGWAVILRLARLLRVFTMSERSDVGQAARELAAAVRERRLELGLSGALAFFAIAMASVGMYLAERAAQPEAFGSIPRAMWWAVVTITTVGYGDVTPVTAMGKVIAGITALLSVALIAVPAGIMAAAFSDAIQRTRNRRDR